MLAPSFRSFDTLYLGGGTPSVLSDELLGDLLDGLRRLLSIHADAEITIEVNPGDIDAGRSHRLRSLGIGRVSVGVQSFDDGILRFLGRRHDRARAMAALDDLRSAGFDNVGIDIMWGIPNQTFAQLLSSVQQALVCAPEHISCYALTIEPGTPLRRDVKAQRIPWKDDDDLAEEATALWQALAKAGYDHYEVSNFARTPQYRSRHNSKYWMHVPYLGLGPAAHSFDGTRRWANVSSVRDYVASLRSGQLARDFEETLTERQKMVERIMLGLRTSRGLPTSWVNTSAATAEGDASKMDASKIDGLVANGWIVVRDDRLCPTEQGMLVADALAAALVEPWDNE